MIAPSLPSGPRAPAGPQPTDIAPGPGWRQLPSGIWLPPHAGEIADLSAASVLCGPRRRVLAPPDVGPPATNLVAGYLFEDAYQDLAGAVPATTNGHLVRRVNELNGGLPLLAYSDGLRPEFRTDLGPGGDKRGVLFGVGTTLQTSGTFASAAARTYYLVLLITAGNDAVVFGRTTLASTASEYAYYAPSPASDALVADGTQVMGVSGQFPTSSYGVFAFRIDKSTNPGFIDSYLDNVSTVSATGSYGTGSYTGSLMINTYELNTSRDGGEVRFLALLAYDGTDDSTRRAAVQAWAAATYGI